MKRVSTALPCPAGVGFKLKELMAAVSSADAAPTTQQHEVFGVLSERAGDALEPPRTARERGRATLRGHAPRARGPRDRREDVERDPLKGISQRNRRGLSGALGVPDGQDTALAHVRCQFRRGGCASRLHRLRLDADRFGAQAIRRHPLRTGQAVASGCSSVRRYSPECPSSTGSSTRPTSLSSCA